jgi:hypothetical protein
MPRLPRDATGASVDLVASLFLVTSPLFVLAVTRFARRPPGRSVDYREGKKSEGVEDSYSDDFRERDRNPTSP